METSTLNILIICVTVVVLTLLGKKKSRIERSIESDVKRILEKK